MQRVYFFGIYHRAAETGVDVSVCIVEKGSEVGAHILSGNVFETRALVRSNLHFFCDASNCCQLSPS